MPPTSRLTPRADGALVAETLPEVPFKGPRLQGELSSEGELRLSIWGAGEVGRLRIEGFEGPFAIGPNRIEGANGAGLFLAQTAPAMTLRGVRASLLREEGEGRLRLKAVGGDWSVAAGADADEAAVAASFDLGRIIAESAAYAARCDQLGGGEPLLRSLVIHGVHAALASICHDAHGGFVGLAAGFDYASPPRTYYRDSYWTFPILLRLAPNLVGAEIEILARQVQPSGEAPSGVICAGPHAEAFERRRLDELAMAAVHWRPGDWWSDHFDSPLLFVLAIGDHAVATGDLSLAKANWPKLRAIFDRYRAAQGFQGLPVKPRNDRDWADNVFRSGLVAYDLGLWVGALVALARVGDALDPEFARQARIEAEHAQSAIDQALWLGGCYADYVRPDGSAEPHVALDALAVLRFGAAPDARADTMLAACRDRLESRRNRTQPYGDWGTLCVDPPFARPEELRAKSAFSYRYHNGGDWPWLDGLYAAERLRRGLSGWRYPLTRWWEACLENGWAGAVEHFSPAYGRGSLLQAWSSLPAAVALDHRDQVLAGDPDTQYGDPRRG